MRIIILHYIDIIMITILFQQCNSYFTLRTTKENNTVETFSLFNCVSQEAAYLDLYPHSACIYVHLL